MVYFTSTARQENWLHYNGGRYVEVAVFQRTQGICQGEYIAECATSTCGYLLNIERFFGRVCVPAVYYPRRGITNGPQPYCRFPIHNVNNIIQNSGLATGETGSQLSGMLRYPPTSLTNTTFGSLTAHAAACGFSSDHEAELLHDPGRGPSRCCLGWSRSPNGIQAVSRCLYVSPLSRIRYKIELRRLYPKSFKSDDLHNNSLFES
ncbi:uncharacterized protein HD556DRAFT_1313027 [Suillus plorans]|uniref:Uncharacterized protein n=1 Tax=Suillus plorans TaxID=116603 RepID=A0A9P7AF58_9AGAM|nr:uncharacterized protein HD556DRAFT_1313027 [Suillus plorans]KAG1787081.1 hypothetical protein HD556DRAFT_1313027 [Suillus plorans]